jgi:hypothetical protein
MGVALDDQLPAILANGSPIGFTDEAGDRFLLGLLLLLFGDTVWGGLCGLDATCDGAGEHRCYNAADRKA